MTRSQLLQNIENLFDYKCVTDIFGNEYIFYSSSNWDHVENEGKEDKTALEAIENHVHLLDHVKLKELKVLTSFAHWLAKTMLSALEAKYPEKKFVVYITISIGDSFIVRFHQQWPNESYYFNPDFLNTSKEKIIMYESHR